MEPIINHKYYEEKYRLDLYHSYGSCHHFYLTLCNSIDCSQFAIDTYEIYSGIDISGVEFVNCHYDLESNARISFYDLNKAIDPDKFEFGSFSLTEALESWDLSLNRTTKTTNLYLATRDKWATQWTT